MYGKILANRLNHAIHNDNIVHYSQTGFVKHRHLPENVMKIMEIINHCDKFNKNALLISFDFEKAFDSLEFESMFTTLVAMNFGPKIWTWL